MKVTKIIINNFRLLKEFTLDLEQDLSLVIGKNNSGKTSILTALDKVLNQTDKKAIAFDDFNVDLRKKIESILLGKDSIESEEDYSPLGIELKLYCSGLIEPDTLMRDNNRQSERCHHESKTNT